jgi:hypothetical protein
LYILNDLSSTQNNKSFQKKFATLAARAAFVIAFSSFLLHKRIFLTKTIIFLISYKEFKVKLVIYAHFFYTKPNKKIFVPLTE